MLVTWIGRLIVLSLFNRIIPPLEPSSNAADGIALPSVSLFVAAKDEERNIAACVRSLESQAYPELEIICADDRSTDRTPQILSELTEQYSRTSAIRINELPDGWFGKSHAMHKAVATSTGEWLCFTDADCEFLSPHTLSSAVRSAIESDADFLSILPSHKAESFWERVVQPACSAIMMLWFSPMAVNRGRADYANGAFMLMKRSCYDAFGGHAAARNDLNEDIVFARLARRANQNLRVQLGRGMYTVRMYETVRQMWRGWTRIFTGTFTSAIRIFLAILVLFYFTFFPWLVAAIGLMTTPTDAWTWAALPGIAVLSIVFQIAAMSVFYHLSCVPYRYGLVYPLGGALGLGILANAFWCALGGGRVVWRGTTYRSGAIESGPEDSSDQLRTDDAEIDTLPVGAGASDASGS